jgi:hypothetical protein
LRDSAGRSRSDCHDDEWTFMERMMTQHCCLAGPDQEEQMKFTIIAVSAAALIASAPAVYAQGASSKTPGHEMQQHGSKKGSPGASGYSPGHEMQARGSKKGSPGASGYAPGQTTGSNMKSSRGTNTKSKY